MAAPSRKILTVFPEDLLSKLDSTVCATGICRSEIIRRSVLTFLKSQKELEMKKGYKEMAGINMELAEMGLLADNEIMLKDE